MIEMGYMLQMKIKTTVMKSYLCGYSDAYILIIGTMSVAKTAAADADGRNTKSKVIFKICAPCKD